MSRWGRGNEDHFGVERLVREAISFRKCVSHNSWYSHAVNFPKGQGLADCHRRCSANLEHYLELEAQVEAQDLNFAIP